MAVNVKCYNHDCLIINLTTFRDRPYSLYKQDHLIIN